MGRDAGRKQRREEIWDALGQAVFIRYDCCLLLLLLLLLALVEGSTIARETWIGMRLRGEMEARRGTRGRKRNEASE